MSKTLLLKPILSEKAYGLSQQLNTYAFEVPKGVNRQVVAKAVADQYEVTVTGVRMAGTPAKSRRFYNRGARKFHTHQMSESRKAYVTLKDGDNLPFFAAGETKEED